LASFSVLARSLSRQNSNSMLFESCRMRFSFTVAANKNM
jgi:hypothetical protein